MTHLHFVSFHHLGPFAFATPCNPPFSPKTVHFVTFYFLFHWGFCSFGGIFRVIFITSVIELIYNQVFTDIVQRCKFGCVGCWQLHGHIHHLTIGYRWCELEGNRRVYVNVFLNPFSKINSL